MTQLETMTAVGVVVLLILIWLWAFAEFGCCVAFAETKSGRSARVTHASIISNTKAVIRMSPLLRTTLSFTSAC